MKHGWGATRYMSLSGLLPTFVDPVGRNRRMGLTLGALCLALVSASTDVAQAQTIGQSVGEHVNDNLKGGSKKPKPKGHTKHSSSPGPATGAWSPAPQSEPGPPVPQGPEYPLRIFGGKFQIDPSTSVAYRGWRPQSYPHINVSTQNAATWAVGVRFKLYFVSVEQARYESNGVSSPRVSGGGAATKVAQGIPAAAWFVGALGFPINWVLEPIIRYEARSFQTHLSPQAPIRVVPHSASKNDDLSAFPATMDRLTMTSAFETLVVGLKYHHENDPTGMISTRSGNFPSVYFGLGLMQYWKPYMVRVGDSVLDGVLFDARLRGGGLALGVSTPMKPERFYVDFSGQVGIGDVQLTSGFTLNQTLPKGWMIGYAQADLTAGYLYPLLRTRPGLLVGASGSLGGATFFYFKPVSQEGENDNAPILNWDLLWGLRANIVLPL